MKGQTKELGLEENRLYTLGEGEEPEDVEEEYQGIPEPQPQQEHPQPQAQEFFELNHNGFSVRVGSCLLRADQLADLALNFYHAVDPNKKPSSTTYT